MTAFGREPSTMSVDQAVVIRECVRLLSRIVKLLDECGPTPYRAEPNKADPVDATDPETRLTFRQAAKLAGVGLTTIYAWARPTDYLGRPKRFLETVTLGGTRYTSREALRHFQQQGPRQVIRQPRSVDLRTIQQREDAERKRLAERGIKI